jgi:hypothetical protein
MDSSTWATLSADSGSSYSWTNSKYITVSWGAISDPGGSGTTAVRFAYTPGSCTAPASDWNAVTGDGSGSQTFTQDRSSSCLQGVHVFKVYAKDGAGNESTEASAKSVGYHFDSDPTPESLGADPAWTDPVGLKPDGLTVSPAGQSASNSFTVRWTNPAPNGTTQSPIAKIWYRVGNGEAQSEIVGAVCIGTTCTVNGLVAPSGGAHPIKVWLEDQAGNSDLRQSASGVLNWGGGDCP